MELKRNIGFWGIFSIATGAMISSGIFILPSLAFKLCGPALPLAYLLAGILALIGIQSMIELATAMPKAGGDYFFVNRSFGPVMGTFSGFLGWLALTLKSAFAVYGISKFINLFFGLSPLISGAVIILFFVILNLVGAKEASMVQLLLVVLLLLILSIFIFSGLNKVDKLAFTPLFPNGKFQVVKTAAFVFISFGGLLKVANVAEEVKEPSKNLPKAIISSIITVTIFYVLTVYVVTGVLPKETFLGSTEPVALAAQATLGKIGFILISIASLLAFFTTANAGLMAASRYPLSMSRDGLIPPFFDKLNKHGIPFVSLFTTGIMMFLALLVPLKLLVGLSSTVILISYILTNASVLVFRESKILNYKPAYKTKFYPYLQIFSIILFIYFIVLLGGKTATIALVFILLSLLIFFFYGRKNYEGETALLYLVKRLSGGELTEKLLEKELKDIIDCRDYSVETLISKAEILDIESKTSYTELLKLIIPSLSTECELSVEQIQTLFLEREEKDPTVLTPFLAVPHIITKVEGKMFFGIVRCKNGISFSPTYKEVKAIFFFGGPLTQREHHLKLLAEIVKKANKKDFEKNWIAAKGKKGLRKILK